MSVFSSKSPKSRHSESTFEFHQTNKKPANFPTHHLPSLESYQMNGKYVLQTSPNKINNSRLIFQFKKQQQTLYALVRLPLPGSVANFNGINLLTNEQEQQDNYRLYPHERNQWTTFVYVEGMCVQK